MLIEKIVSVLSDSPRAFITLKDWVLRWEGTFPKFFILLSLVAQHLSLLHWGLWSTITKRIRFWYTLVLKHDCMYKSDYNQNDDLIIIILKSQEKSRTLFTVWKLQKFSLMIDFQKFRETNLFCSRLLTLHCRLFSRIFER